MSEIAFRDALAFLLRPDVEGGASDHPRDGGGLTNRGITQKKLDEVRAVHRAAAGFPLSVLELSLEQTAWVYRVEYWNRANCDELPDLVSLVVFDAAVNSGVGRAARWLQQAVRVNVDGVIGAQTIAAVRAAHLGELLIEFNARRAWHFMLQDSVDEIFGLGWARRLIRLHDKAARAGGLE